MIYYIYSRSEKKFYFLGHKNPMFKLFNFQFQISNTTNKKNKRQDKKI